MAATALTAAPDRAILWAPRLLAVVVALFLAIFSLDAFDGAATFGEVLPDFLLHLIPTAIVLAVAALAWNREWIGAVTFLGLAVAYAIPARTHPSWVAAISGPMLLVAALYVWSWMHRRTGR